MDVPMETGKLRCPLSVGIEMLPDDETSAEALLRNGDRALYVAKALGRNRVVTYDLGGLRMRATGQADARGRICDE